MTEWHPVVGYEGIYEASSDGNIRNARTGRVLRPARTHDGHLQVALYSNGPKSHLVHRLVAEAFLGSPAAGLEVCHNNGVPDDNRVLNLRWDTRSANRLDRVKHGTDHNAKKTHCIRGHEFDAENTMVDKHGRRSCRACNYASQRRRWAKRRAEA